MSSQGLSAGRTAGTRPPGKVRRRAGWGTAAAGPEGRGQQAAGRGRRGGAGPGPRPGGAAGTQPSSGPSKRGPLKEINSTPRGNFNEKQKLQSQSIQKISVESFSLAHDKKLYKTVRSLKQGHRDKKKAKL